MVGMVSRIIPATVRASRVIGSSRHTLIAPLARGLNFELLIELAVVGDFPAVAQDEGVHAQAIGQGRSGIEFDQSFQNLGIDLLGGFVGTDILGPQLLPYSHNMSPKLLFAVSVGGDVGALAHADFADISLVNINAYAQRLAIADGQDWVGHSRGIRNALATAVMLAQHRPVDGRTDERLLVASFGLIQLRLSQLYISLGKRLVFLARVVVYQGVLLNRGVVLGLGDVSLASETIAFLARHHSRREQLLAAMRLGLGILHDGFRFVHGRPRFGSLLVTSAVDHLAQGGLFCGYVGASGFDLGAVISVLKFGQHFAAMERIAFFHIDNLQPSAQLGTDLDVLR